MNKMINFESCSRFLTWFMALLLSALVAGCGSGGDGGRDPVLGIGGVVVGAGGIPGAPPGAVVPGLLTCVAANANPAIPRVISSDPTNNVNPPGNLVTTTSTAGVVNNGKLITATFSLAMNPATINSSPAGTLLTFTLKNNTTAGSNVAGTVLLNAAGTLATFTTTAALPANSSFTATITQAATSATVPGIPIACIFAWNFSTGPVAVGLAPVNLGLAAPFGVAATAGVTNTPTLPLTTINGNVVLDPVAGATCNAVAVDAAGGFGVCGGSPPIIHGQVISPLFPDAGVTSGNVKLALRAAFLAITPPAGPPAAGSLGGATAIPAGTTLGAPTGSALVQGDNLFAPGVYQSLTSILITGDLTLDAGGDPNASFIFQSSSTIGTAAGAASPGVHTRILLVNGAKASNVFWQAGTSATLGAFSEFQGNILAAADITMVTGATSCGRLLAGAFTAGAFVFDSNVVSVPGNPNAPASCQ